MLHHCPPTHWNANAFFYCLISQRKKQHIQSFNGQSFYFIGQCVKPFSLWWCCGTEEYLLLDSLGDTWWSTYHSKRANNSFTSANMWKVRFPAGQGGKLDIPHYAIVHVYLLLLQWCVTCNVLLYSHFVESNLMCVVVLSATPQLWQEKTDISP